MLAMHQHFPEKSVHGVVEPHQTNNFFQQHLPGTLGAGWNHDKQNWPSEGHGFTLYLRVKSNILIPLGWIFFNLQQLSFKSCFCKGVGMPWSNLILKHNAPVTPGATGAVCNLQPGYLVNRSCHAHFPVFSFGSSLIIALTRIKYKTMFTIVGKMWNNDQNIKLLGRVSLKFGIATCWNTPRKQNCTQHGRFFSSK